MVIKDQATKGIMEFFLSVEHNGQQQFYEFVQESVLPHVQGIEHKLFDPIRRKQSVTLLNLYKVRKPGSKKTPM